MQLSPLLQYPMYELEDLLGGFGDEQRSQGAFIDTYVPGQFTTHAAADSFYAAFTAQGGVLKEGMSRTIGGYLETYRGGAWRGVMPTVHQLTVFYTTTYNGDSEVVVGQIAIDDPGQTYFADVSGGVTIGADAGTNVNTLIRLDSATGAAASYGGFRDGLLPPAAVSVGFPPYRIGPLTGAHSLVLTVRRALGSGNWWVATAGNYIRADVVPV